MTDPKPEPEPGPDPALWRGIALLAAVAAGAIGVIAGVAIASECWVDGHRTEVASAGYAGALFYLGGCACILIVMRTVLQGRS